MFILAEKTEFRYPGSEQQQKERNDMTQKVLTKEEIQLANEQVGKDLLQRLGLDVTAYLLDEVVKFIHQIEMLAELNKHATERTTM